MDFIISIFEISTWAITDDQHKLIELMSYLEGDALEWFGNDVALNISTLCLAKHIKRIENSNYYLVISILTQKLIEILIKAKYKTYFTFKSE
jgi:hypothetical protein